MPALYDLDVIADVRVGRFQGRDFDMASVFQRDINGQTVSNPTGIGNTRRPNGEDSARHAGVLNSSVEVHKDAEKGDEREDASGNEGLLGPFAPQSAL